MTIIGEYSKKQTYYIPEIYSTIDMSASRPEYLASIPKPKNQYPVWLDEILDGKAPLSSAPNKPLKIPDYMKNPGPPANILNSQITGPSKPIPPVHIPPRRPEIQVGFRVLDSMDNPISDYEITTSNPDEKSLWTDERGEAGLSALVGVPLRCSGGRLGWVKPLGAKRRKRLEHLLPIAFEIKPYSSQTIPIYPESGLYEIGSNIYEQIVY